MVTALYTSAFGEFTSICLRTLEMIRSRPPWKNIWM